MDGLSKNTIFCQLFSNFKPNFKVHEIGPKWSNFSQETPQLGLFQKLTCSVQKLDFVAFQRTSNQLRTLQLRASNLIILNWEAKCVHKLPEYGL